MLMAALYELMSESEKQDFLETMNRLFPGVEIQPRQAVTCGITGTHMDVTVRGEEEHSHDVALGCGHDHDHTMNTIMSTTTAMRMTIITTMTMTMAIPTITPLRRTSPPCWMPWMPRRR